MCSLARRTWFMPALAKRRVGSSKGIVGEDATKVWSFSLKKSKNCCLTARDDHFPVYWDMLRWAIRNDRGPDLLNRMDIGISTDSSDHAKGELHT